MAFLKKTLILTVVGILAGIAASERQNFLQYGKEQKFRKGEDDGHDRRPPHRPPPPSPHHNDTGADINLQPVIGIVAQTLEPEMQVDARFANSTYYIMSSFVRFLQGAGARIVPLVPSMSEEETTERLSKLNGVFLPGGDGDYYDYAKFLYNKVIEMNDNGTYIPMWGTCMGYEQIANYTASNGDPNELYYLTHTSLALKFVRDPRETKMYGQMGDEARLFEDHNYTYNGHNWGIDPSKFETDQGLKDFFHVNTISYMPSPDNRPFVTSIEGKKYPIYGTLFHPEMASQLFIDNYGANHEWLSIQLNRHFSDYFVYLARHSTNYYGDFLTVQADLVDNYQTFLTENQDLVYVFN